MDDQKFHLDVQKGGAKESVKNAILSLGIPREEIAQIMVATQVGDGVPIGQKDRINVLNKGRCKTGNTVEMYHIVDIKRSVAQLPVYTSTITAAVKDKGIQRMKVRFPPFQLKRGFRLLKKDDVIEGLVKK